MQICPPPVAQHSTVYLISAFGMSPVLGNRQITKSRYNGTESRMSTFLCSIVTKLVRMIWLGLVMSREGILGIPSVSVPGWVYWRR